MCNDTFVAPHFLHVGFFPVLPLHPTVSQGALILICIRPCISAYITWV